MEEDSRFRKFATDPKFRSVSRKDKKVKIDKRFQSMFTDKRFSNKVGVDKRGRPENYSSKETYQKFYRVSDKKKRDGQGDNSSDDSDSTDDEDDQEEKKAAAKVTDMDKQPDYARGEGQLESSSSEEESSEEEEEKDSSKAAAAEDEAFDKWGELDHDAERTDEISRRLAVCNLDWDRVGAQDIFLVLSSFCPKSQRVESVRVYLSEFGKSRLKDEEKLGPEELRSKSKLKTNSKPDSADGDSSSDDQDALSDEEDRLISGDVVDDQEAIDKEAIERVRLYQIRKLKYYYAVAEFTSEEAANTVYTECDGQEYELSATRFDLRFIPDDMDFDLGDMREECLTTPDPDKYKPKVFFNKALMQGKAELTWDEDDPNRQAAMRRAFDDPEGGLDNEDLKAFIADAESSGGEEENETAPGGFQSVIAPAESSDEDDESRVERYKALLLGGDTGDTSAPGGKSKKQASKKKSDGINMEMTFADTSKAEAEHKQKEFEGMTPWEQYLHKKKEKRKSKKLLMAEKSGKAEDSEDSDDDVPEDLKDDPFFQHSDDDEEERIRRADQEKKDSLKSKKKKKKGGDKKEAAEVADLPLLVMDSDDDKNHFDYKEIVKTDTMSKKKLKKLKKKKDKEDATKGDDFQMNLHDDRFGAVFESADFNVDPSHPNFKKTKSMQAIVEEKQKRIVTGKRKVVAGDSQEQSSKKPKSQQSSAVSEKSVSEKSDSLQKLMHSVKAKSNHMYAIKAKKKVKKQ